MGERCTKRREGVHGCLLFKMPGVAWARKCLRPSVAWRWIGVAIGLEKRRGAGGKLGGLLGTRKGTRSPECLRTCRSPECLRPCRSPAGGKILIFLAWGASIPALIEWTYPREVQNRNGLTQNDIPFSEARVNSSLGSRSRCFGSTDLLGDSV
jgi:hypothetical protein